jgi:hypothetical protein
MLVHSKMQTIKNFLNLIVFALQKWKGEAVIRFGLVRAAWHPNEYGAVYSGLINKSTCKYFSVTKDLLVCLSGGFQLRDVCGSST